MKYHDINIQIFYFFFLLISQISNPIEIFSKYISSMYLLKVHRWDTNVFMREIRDVFSSFSFQFAINAYTYMKTGVI